ncbi:MAG: hypothetical protein Kow0070_00470 [Anaerolineales bacterium]
MYYHRMLKRLLGDILTDLGPLEGDYRAANLQRDIRQGILYMLVVGLGVLTMLSANAALDQNQPVSFERMIAYRAVYAAVTAVLAAFLYKTTKVRTYDRLMTGWLVVSLLLNLNRSAEPLALFDIILLFVVYLASPLQYHHTAALGVGFSASVFYLDHFVKTDSETVFFTARLFAHLTTHLLGTIAFLQLQTYRRKSFQALVDEKDAKEMVAYLANMDPLTKSLTRRQFLNIAESEFRRYQRYQRPLSILILDADNFKKINERYGHHAGDLVLRSLSLVAMEQKRAQDTFGRLGGEEFGLLMPETALDKARVVAERIRLVWEASPVKLDGELIRSTISIGLAQADSTDRSLEDLLRRADQMLFKAKTNGRNRIEA